MKKQYFKKGKDNYYFSIRSGNQNIMIKRDTKEAAQRAYLNYIRIGKECEWLGKWTGKTYTETSVPVETTS
ncbi:MAG: hypothetical protein GY705_22515 [Bacteroidetes bacterium]|nr:hypothetical protein [Bacteroidota bacterium]